MELKKIYLAGPMEGLTQAAMTGWRQKAALLAASWGWQTVQLLDPCRRATFHGNENDNYARLLFRADLADIDNANCLVVDARRSSGKAAGTNMEIMYAWTKNKPLFLWVDAADPKHPFYVSMATGIFHTMEEAMDAARCYLEV